MTSSTDFLTLDLPVDISSTSKNVAIEERTVKITSSGQELNVFYLEVPHREGAAGERKASFLLLHGMRFTSDTWRQLQTIQVLGALGYRVVAVDLPGYGKTGGQHLRGETAGDFLSWLIETVGLSDVILVSPSMSGSYALPYIFAPKSASSSGAPRLAGYIPVAPIETGSYTREQYGQKSKLPVLIVYGENDSVMGAESLSNLTGFPDKRILCFPGAGHPCYLDDPELWHRALYNFVQKL